MGIQNHRHKDDRVAKKDRDDRLPPVHPFGNQ
jgi:hypothetical protein